MTNITVVLDVIDPSHYTHTHAQTNQEIPRRPSTADPTRAPRVHVNTRQQQPAKTTTCTAWCLPLQGHKGPPTAAMDSQAPSRTTGVHVKVCETALVPQTTAPPPGYTLISRCDSNVSSIHRSKTLTEVETVSQGSGTPTEPSSEAPRPRC